MRLAALALLAVAASAGTKREAATAAVVEGLVRGDEPGLALLVRLDGKTVFARGYGVRDLRSRERIDPGTAFRLASVSKQFTATAVMLLVRDGKLRYEDALTDLVPSFPAYGKGITIRHLLTHTSGLPDYEELMAAAERGRSPIWTSVRQIQDEGVLALLRSETKGRFPPGTSWAYSNTGYVVLGLVVARVSGKPFGEFLHERVFAPLGMDRTLAYQQGHNEVASRAFGHTREAEGFRLTDQSATSATLGDGGVYSTLADLAKWDEALRQGTLVSPSAMKPALTPVTLAGGAVPRWPPGPRGGDDLAPGEPVAYGFGWFLDPWRGRNRIWHHGETIGFRTVIERFPDDRLSVVILANRDDLDPATLALRAAEPWLDAPAPTPAPPTAEKGIEAGDLDRGAAPCTDFYQFANGAWRAQNPIPTGATRWSRRWAAVEATRQQLEVILGEAAASTRWPKGSVEQLIGDHYAACLDEKRIEELGPEPIRPLLGEIDGIADMAGVGRMIGRLHELSVPVPFGLQAAADSHEPTRVIANIYASGLGLPDRDYYLKPEPRFQEVREKYRSHVMRMLELTGLRRAEARRAAEQVFAMERQLAQASLDDEARRDPRATDHKTSFLNLTELAPQFDWGGYFAAAKLPRAALNVEQPEFLKAVDGLVLDTSLGAWRAYLKWHLVRSAAPYLSTPFVQESSGFRGQYLGGAMETKPRSRHCAESTDELLGEALGRRYVEKHFPPAAKARMQELVKNLLLATGDTIRGLEWMGPETKAKALEKLTNLHAKIGYPDAWKDYSHVEIRRDAFWADVAAARGFNVANDRARIGKPVDRGRWSVTPSTSDAYYDPLQNEIVFPAGALQPPAFRLDAADAANYGAIGVVIGHEISHGFDDEGAKYDAKGRLASWWTAKDLAQFRARALCVAGQFDGYFVEPGIHHNGSLVLGESIGDLAGAEISYRAFRRSLEGRPQAPTIDGFTPEQQFFIAWGQFRGDAIRPETERLMVESDPHPTGKYRVIGPLSNLPEFQKAFACPADAPMVRPAEKRCEVW